jgi:hypothetical protein
VTGLQVVQENGTTQPIHRVPSGEELRGPTRDDSLLEAPWTGDVVTADSVGFLVTVRPSR